MTSAKNIKWVQLTSGQGPEECELAVRHVLERFLDEANENTVNVDILEKESGIKSDNYKSVMLSLWGDNNIDRFLTRWNGTVQWVCQSPYRPTHKRKNWFVGVNVLIPVESWEGVSSKDLKFETMRASGAGGQHINTTDSAVRVIHVPTGLSAFAQEERSQYMNKKLAVARLVMLMKDIQKLKQLEKKLEKRKKHLGLERGNPIRVFEGNKFKEKHI